MATNKSKKAAYTESHKGNAARSSSNTSVQADVVFIPDHKLEDKTVGSSKASKSSTSTSASSASSKSASSASSKSAHQKHMAVSVKDIMTPRVVAVTSVTFLPEAAQIMLQEDVGALPVVQEDGKLTGIITDRDITVRAVAEGRNIANTQVAEIFTAEDLVTVTADFGLHEAEQLMADHQVRRLPVVDTDNKIVGMVSLGDISRVTSEKESGQVLSDISKPGGDHTQSTEGVIE